MGLKVAFLSRGYGGRMRGSNPASRGIDPVNRLWLYGHGQNSFDLEYRKVGPGFQLSALGGPQVAQRVDGKSTCAPASQLWADQ